MLDCLRGAVNLKVVWKCAKIADGVPCATISGTVLMQELFAGSLDMQV